MRLGACPHCYYAVMWVADKKVYNCANCSNKFGEAAFDSYPEEQLNEDLIIERGKRVFKNYKKLARDILK